MQSKDLGDILINTEKKFEFSVEKEIDYVEVGCWCMSSKAKGKKVTGILTPNASKNIGKNHKIVNVIYKDGNKESIKLLYNVKNGTSDSDRELADRSEGIQKGSS